MVATGVLIGFAFLTKQLQALLVVPGFAVTYLVVGPGGWWRRVRHVLLGAARDGRRRGVVDRHRHAVADRLAAVRRRLADEQHLRPHVRLQRLRPPHRQRGRQRHRRPPGGLGPDRHRTPRRQRQRWPDRLAAAGRRDRRGRRPVVPAPRPAHRRAAGRAPGVRQLARRDVAGVQLHAGHLPRVLHGRPRRADGRRRRRRCRHRVAPSPRGARRRGAGRGDRRHRAVVGDPAAPQRRLERLAPDRR